MTHAVDGYSLALDFKVTARTAAGSGSTPRSSTRVVLDAGGPVLLREGLDAHRARSSNAIAPRTGCSASSRSSASLDPGGHAADRISGAASSRRRRPDDADAIHCARRRRSPRASPAAAGRSSAVADPSRVDDPEVNDATSPFVTWGEVVVLDGDPRPVLSSAAGDAAASEIHRSTAASADASAHGSRRRRRLALARLRGRSRRSGDAMRMLRSWPGDAKSRADLQEVWRAASIDVSAGRDAGRAALAGPRSRERATSRPATIAGAAHAA